MGTAPTENHMDHMDNRVDNVDNRVDHMDNRVDSVDNRVDSVDNRVDNRTGDGFKTRPYRHTGKKTCGCCRSEPPCSPDRTQTMVSPELSKTLAFRRRKVHGCRYTTLWIGSSYQNGPQSPSCLDTEISKKGFDGSDVRVKDPRTFPCPQTCPYSRHTGTLARGNVHNVERKPTA